MIDDKGKDENGKPKLTARQVVVTTGMTRGDQVVVLNGIKEGETIVTTGQIKLRNGFPVIIDNANIPKFDANPVPASNQ